MADPAAYCEPGDDTPMTQSEARPPGMPRWVKVSGIIVIVVILLVVGLMLFRDHGGGAGSEQHGPGRHGAAGGALTEGFDAR